ncbi:MAG: NPCBM/NEW2 domain-containing protein [Planctomycetales bacterium]|nr:NPCBM/NEW2 domain-containing protein [Planctomycetales bacterium]
MVKQILTGWLVIAAMVSGLDAQNTKTLWLDELDVSNATAGWGRTRANKSVDGNVLTVNSQTFERGIGTHAEGQFTIRLDGSAAVFTAMVGVDDEIAQSPNGRHYASVTFLVIGDGKELFNSGAMKAQTSAKPVSVKLDGIKLFRLIASDSGDGIDYDHADWAMAKIEYNGSRPEAIEPIKPKPYILTPKPGPEPRITGPAVFGARPGNPFLFTVTATGERPMTFEARGLPKGLALDSQTGHITGTVEKTGKYQTTVAAKNSRGRAERSFTIVIGDTICLTPPMGWNSWNCWGCAVDDAKVRATARAMADTELIHHGWSYINIDDCWMRKRGSNDPVTGDPVRDKDGRILCNDKFPDMNALTDYIHGLGLKAGIYIGPGPTTCQNYEASWQHELLDAQQFAEWGFDYLKYDWCGYSSVSGNQTLEDLQRPYILMRQMLDQVGRDIVYSVCQYGWGEVWKWGGQIGGNCWRTTGDITDSWSSMAGIGFQQADLYSYAHPGHWNDPDMLVVGKVGWGPNLHDSHLTPDEQYTHISLWCLLSAPLLIGCPIEQMDEFTLNLLTNDEVLEVNQDPSGRQARCVKKDSTAQVWVKTMEDGSQAVGFFNLNGFEAAAISVNWQTLGLEPASRWRVRDLWRQKDLETAQGTFSTPQVPPHGVLLVRLFPHK